MPQKTPDSVQQQMPEERESPPVNRQMASTVPYIGYQAPSSQNGNLFLLESTPIHTSSTAVSSSRELENIAGSEKLVNLYYKFFHDAHPFILPKAVFMDRWKSDNSTMRPLMLAIQFVGSIYADRARPEIRSKAFQAVTESNGNPNGYLVQANLLLAIALHCNDELENAREFLDVTIRMAIELGMGMKEYAIQNGAGNPVLEESWRRTWWATYITDCMFAGIRSSPTILLRTVESTVDLPCEDENYQRGVSQSIILSGMPKLIGFMKQIPTPHTQDEYNNRDFADQEITFSSFSYLIDAARILGSVLVLYEDTSKSIDRAIAEVDTSLVSWSLNLPKEKSQLVRSNGDVDELLFAAHVIINT
jgi:hypothetical protein